MSVGKVFAHLVPSTYVKMLGILVYTCSNFSAGEAETKGSLGSLVNQHSQMGGLISESKVDSHPEKQHC